MNIVFQVELTKNGKINFQIEQYSKSEFVSIFEKRLKTKVKTYNELMLISTSFRDESKSNLAVYYQTS